LIGDFFINYSFKNFSFNFNLILGSVAFSLSSSLLHLLENIYTMTTKYEQIPSELFVKNREKFAKALQPKSLAVFNSNDIYPVSADSTLPISQHRYIFYLS
jgi:hypothetical protein